MTGRSRSRIASLDVARGLFLVTSVTSVSVIAPVPQWLRHPGWFGVTLYDLIFPLFVTLSGVGLAFAYRRRTSPRVTARRVLVLLVAGVVYTALFSGHVNLQTLRLTGVLQLYAVLVLAAALLHTVVRSARGWALVTLASALLATAVYWWFEARCPSGVLAPTCNPSGVIDTKIFGAHMYAEGRLRHDPEGLVAIGGAFITAAAGTTAGHIAIDARDGSARVGLMRLCLWTAACAVLGVVLAQVIEPFKRLWTPSFALLAAALGLCIFTLVYAVVDVWLGRVRGIRAHPAAWPLVALGRNSLLVYFGSHLAAVFFMRTGGEVSYAERIGQALALLGGPQIAFVVFSLAAWWTIAMVLHRRQIYVRP